MGAKRTGAVLPPGRPDDGGAHRVHADAARRCGSSAVQGGIRTCRMGTGQLRRLAGRKPLPDDTGRGAGLADAASACRELVRRTASFRELIPAAYRPLRCPRPPVAWTMGTLTERGFPSRVTPSVAVLPI